MFSICSKYVTVLFLRSTSIPFSLSDIPLLLTVVTNINGMIYIITLSLINDIKIVFYQLVSIPGEIYRIRGMQNSFYSESQLLWWVVEYISHSIARLFKYLHIGRINCNRQNQLLSSVYRKNMEQISIPELKHHQK